MVLASIAMSLPLAAFGATAAFERNLYFGMRGDADVARMQDFLRGRGYFSYPRSTGNYFTATLDAVRRWQRANGISPVGGYFGPQSRAVANRMPDDAGRTAPPAPVGASAGGRAGVVSGYATTSSYKGKIAIGSVSGWGSAPEYESIILENRADKESVSITGFRIENSRGETFVVPRGEELPGLYPGIGDLIFLKPGDRATITAGKQERQMNFRENLCTGYFDESSNFTPSLSHSCPRPEIKTLAHLSDRCLEIISSVPYCRTAPPAFPSRVPDETCNAYLSAHFSYVGCVADYRSRPDFYSRNWFIWMQRDKEFFRNPVEYVILKDQQGKIVDEYRY